MTKSSTCLLLVCIFYLASCNSSKTGGENANDRVDSTFQSARTQLSKHVNKIVHDLPPPSELPFTLRKEGEVFVSELVNSLENLEEYLVFNSKAAMNLGVYAADIAYLSSYSQVDEAKKYMNGCQKIAERLGIATVFGQSLFDRFQANAGNPDSLAFIVNEAMQDSEKRLENLDELRMASLSLAGSFMESLYLLTKVIGIIRVDENRTEKVKKAQSFALLRLILSQRISLLELVSVLKDTEKDGHINKLIDDMELIRSQYDDLQLYLEGVDATSIDLHSPHIIGILEEIKRIRIDLITP